MAARIFNMGSIFATIVPVFIMVWVAASIFVYASVAHHPDQRVREYNRWSGYRFYGLVGTLVVVLNFSGMMKEWVGGGVNLLLIVWALGFLVIVPLGVRDFLRAGKESWQDLVVEAEAK